MGIGTARNADWEPWKKRDCSRYACVTRRVDAAVDMRSCGGRGQPTENEIYRHHICHGVKGNQSRSSSVRLRMRRVFIEWTQSGCHWARCDECQGSGRTAHGHHDQKCQHTSHLFHKYSPLRRNLSYWFVTSGLLSRERSLLHIDDRAHPRVYATHELVPTAAY